MKKKTYTLDGENYYSLSQIADKSGKSRQLLNSRMEKGMPLLEAANKIPEKPGQSRAKETKVLGKTYRTFKEACKAHNIPEGTIQSRLKNMTMDEAFLYKNTYSIGSLNAEKVIIENIEYSSQAEACKKLGLNNKTVSSRMKRKNISFEEAVAYYKSKEMCNNEPL